MIISQLICPSCKLNFNDRIYFIQDKKSIQLDKTYYYDYIELFCPNCKQQICIFCNEEPILWRKKDQYSYTNFLKKKKNTNFSNNKFLYLYYPCRQKFIIDGLCKHIDINSFDSIITTQDFYYNLKDVDSQLCIIPNYLFQHLNKTLLPNYFIQKIIIRQTQKFENPILYSTYYTFFNCFQLIYKQKNWNILKQYLK